MKGSQERPLLDMMGAIKSLLALLVILLSHYSSLRAQMRGDELTSIWVGSSSGFNISWTRSNVTASPLGDRDGVAFSARDIAEKRFQEFKREGVEQNGRPVCSYAETFRLLGVVGSLISYEASQDSYCADASGRWAWPHPSVDTAYHVIDLKHAATPLKLTDLFPENEILEALLADPLVKKAFTENRITKRPQTLGELLAICEEKSLSFQPLGITSRSPKGCTFTFPENALEQFAFHHLEKDNVAVRIRLQPDSGACRTALAELGLLLSIPESLKPMFVEAEQDRQGFLMKDVFTISKGQVTRFTFAIGKHGRR